MQNCLHTLKFTTYLVSDLSLNVNVLWLEAQLMVCYANLKAISSECGADADFIQITCQKSFCSCPFLNLKDKGEGCSTHVS